LLEVATSEVLLAILVALLASSGEQLFIRHA